MWKFCEELGTSKAVVGLLPTVTRSMSVYAPHYIQPIFDKQRQLELKKADEFNKYAHIPTKAARNNENVSMFYNETVMKFTNYITKKGKKRLARELLTKTFENMKRIQIERLNLAQTVEDRNKIVADPEQLLITAIDNCRPMMQLTAIKRGGVVYQVPVPVTDKRANFMAMNWLLEAGREKERKVHLPEKLAWEILDAAHGQGRVIKRKNDLHRQCEGNRAYAHYRWS